MDEPVLGPLNADPLRQATASLRGYVYQLWRSVLAWVDLDADSLLFLEGAEDFDVIHSGTAVTTQVKLRQGTISLATQEVANSIENHLLTKDRNPEKNIRYRYLTTSLAVQERGEPFGAGRKGIEVWASISKGPDEDYEVDLETIHSVLKQRAGPRLGAFLETRPLKELRQLVREIDWGTGEPGSAEIQERILANLQSVCASVRAHAGDAARIANALFTHAAMLASDPNCPRELSGSAVERIADVETRVPRRDFEALLENANPQSNPVARPVAHFPIPNHRDPIGRDLELESLADGVESTTICHVLGLPGLGKSCLVAAFARRCRSDRPVLWLEGKHVDRAELFLLRLADFAEAVLELPSARTGLCSQAADYGARVQVAAQLMNQHSILVVWDDFDGSAPILTELIKQFGSWLSTGRLVLCGPEHLYCNDVSNPPAVQVLEGLGEPAATALFVEWAPHGIREMEASDIGAIVRRFSGHPQLLKLAACCCRALPARELIDSLPRHIPKINTYLTRILVSEMPDEARGVLRDLALIQGTFPLELVERLAGPGAAHRTLMTATDMLFISRSGRSYSMHSLVAEALAAESCSEEGHARLAAAFSELLGSRFDWRLDHAIQAIHHGLEGNKPVEAAHWSEQSLGFLLHAGAFHAAFQLGKELSAEDALAQCFGVHFGTARALRLSGNFEQSLRWYESAADFAPSAQLRDTAEFEIAAAHCHLGKDAAGLESFRRLSTSASGVVRLQSHLALVPHERNRATSHIRAASRILAGLPEGNPDFGRLSMHIEATRAIHHLDHGDERIGNRALLQAWKLGEEIENEFGQQNLECRCMLASRLMDLHSKAADYEAAIHVAETLVEWEERFGRVRKIPGALHALGRLLCLGNRPAEAVEALQASLRAVRHFGLGSALPSHRTREWLTEALWLQGRYRRSVRELLEYLHACQCLGVPSAAFAHLPKEELTGDLPPSQDGFHVLVLPTELSIQDLQNLAAQLARRDSELAQVAFSAFDVARTRGRTNQS